ncbi:hypothetical protein KC726_03905 [Candidatus Woesebacteria bacterium]|nr:hypothetical protein [Candidatus Woesebacteria bacterium]
MQKQKLIKILSEDPTLIWYTNAKDSVSDESIFEHVLNYGNWEQVQEVIRTLGKEATVELYHKLTSKPRCNIRHRTKHYFDLYFS